MKYQVEWSKDALKQLAQIWTDSTLRAQVTAAAHAVDQELLVDPDQKGISVHEGLQSLEKYPLYVLYSVDEQQGIVEIARVRYAE